MICLVCKAKLSKTQKKFCTYICESAYKQNIVNTRVLAGKVNTQRTLKRYLLRTIGDCCQLCKALPVHNGKQLVMELDHIDGNSDNNEISNLRLVCPNCHSQLLTSVGGISNKKTSKRSKLNSLRKREFIAKLG